MKRNFSNRRPQGFTIIELLVATLVFSVVLVVILSSFVQISRLFYKGVNMTKTQEDARTIVQDISSDIAFAQTSPTFVGVGNNNRPATGYFCIGLHRYDYQLGYQLGSSSGSNNYAIKRENVSFSSGCNATATGTNPEELLDDGMQLNNMSINCDGGRCLINVHVIFYGGTPNELFSTNNSNFTTSPWNAPDAQCTGSITSSQYCAVADYTSTVLQRQ
ncbi:MAG TPA: prepilin-type N-terminal cleavage/methylation domain-containing protein [Candidatus Saccharimonadales bacterium]|nr:prepilin-type N-terminal cleavage/methylation domain-containing protein [Candidatus Saccharimonadales bacterium]